SLAQAIAVDFALIALFALQHSGMARPAFKAWWARMVPPALERSTYVLASALALGAFIAFWEPLGGTLWRIESGWALTAIYAAVAVSWAVLLSATFCIDHFDLFGLRQVWLAARQQPYAERSFMTRGLYRLVRHPIYLGWFLVVWITPVMTLSHLFFALLLTGYVLKAIRWEERDLMAALPEYAAYREQVPMVLPSPGRSVPAVAAPTADAL
ncbi:MAG: isoprenylcysteine carboxylmethyltransferase family protein, partial [Pseudomonadota bacterium]